MPTRGSWASGILSCSMNRRNLLAETQLGASVGRTSRAAAALPVRIPIYERAISYAICHNKRVMAATSGTERTAPVERWSSVEEICGHLGVSRDTIYRWIADRGMPAHRIGRLWKFKLSEVDGWARTKPERA